MTLLPTPAELCRTLLQDAYAARRAKNPQYSLRAFSRDLGVSPASLSQVLSQKRELSLQNRERIAEKLALSPAERDALCGRAAAKENQGGRRQLEDDVFRLMSDWYYFAILSLARTPSCRAAPGWVARRLGISRIEAQGAIERLTRLGLIRRDKHRLTRTSTPLTTTVDVPSSALRKFHKQHLQIAQQRIDSDPPEEREITTVTMAIDPKRIQQAKRMIREFRDTLSNFLESGEGEEVFTLAIQLFALTRSGRAT